MSAIATYFIFLFTLQLIIILSGSPASWLLLVWGSLFTLLFIYGQRLYYPADHPQFFWRKRVLQFCLLLLSLLIVSNLYFSHRVAQMQHSSLALSLEELGDDKKWIRGTLLTPAHIDGGRIRFTARVEALNGTPLAQFEKVVISHYVHSVEERERYVDLKRGDRWSGYVRLIPPSPARNPGAFDYGQYLKRQGIHFSAQVEGPWQEERVEPNPFSLTGLIDRFRQSWMGQTEQLFSRETGAIVQAVTVGYREGIDEELGRVYQELGVIHLLAISGLHVGILLGGLYLLFTALPLTRETIYTLLALFVPVYVMLSGWQVSAVRAGLTALVLILCLRFRLGRHALLALYLVYMLILLVQPYYLYHVGFQLSFAITFALLTVVPKLYPLLPGKGERWRQALAVALVAELTSLPIILWHFHSFSPLSLVINLMIVPLYSLIYIPGAFLLTALSYIDLQLVQPLAWIYDASLQMIHDGLAALYRWPWSRINTGRPSCWWLLAFLLIFTAISLAAEKGKRGRTFVYIGLMPFLLLVQVIHPYLDGKGIVTMLDVGQGEAIVIEAPFRNEVVLIDVGGEFRFYQEEWQQPERAFEVGRDVILPFLRYRGINRVDTVVISHEHADHLAGIEGLLGRIPISRIFYPPLMPQSEWAQKLIREVQAERIPVYSLKAGDAWEAGAQQFKVLFPPVEAVPVERALHVHDYNLVLWHKVYETVFLWTGDVEAAGEGRMLRDHPALRADVLKVAHHGSGTSTSQLWLEQVSPDVALISVGANNRYGHPDRQVLARLEKKGVRVLRTDQRGGIMIVVKPGEYIIQPTLQGDEQPVQ